VSITDCNRTCYDLFVGGTHWISGVRKWAALLCQAG
jgi:hypothetical protein